MAHRGSTTTVARSRSGPVHAGSMTPASTPGCASRAIAWLASNGSPLFSGSGSFRAAASTAGALSLGWLHRQPPKIATTQSKAARTLGLYHRRVASWDGRVTARTRPFLGPQAELDSEHREQEPGDDQREAPWQHVRADAE